MLLSGRSGEGLAATGPVICACFGVGRASICDAIAAGAATPAEIGARLKAGTNCGSCIPEMKRLIAQTAVAEQPKVAVAS
jgi:assimilatory nitrate reductase catalytic subunit